MGLLRQYDTCTHPGNWGGRWCKVRVAAAGAAAALSGTWYRYLNNTRGTDVQTSILTALDWLVIVLYFIVIGAVAWWYGRHQKDSVDYFLAGRNAGFITIGASIFTSNIGSEHIVGLAGQGAATGMAMAHWELHAWVLILLAGVFVPFYYRAGVETIPEFLRSEEHTSELQ